jgi:hypothetical protein
MEDVLRETIEKAKKIGVWEKLSPSEQLKLSPNIFKSISKCPTISNNPVTCYCFSVLLNSVHSSMLTCMQQLE